MTVHSSCGYSSFQLRGRAMSAVKDRFKSLVKKVFRRRSAQPASRTNSRSLTVEWLENRDLLATYIWLGSASATEDSGSWNAPKTEQTKYWQNEAGQRVWANPGAQDTVKFTSTSPKHCTVDAETAVGAIELDDYSGHLILNQNLATRGGFLKTTTPGTT